MGGDNPVVVITDTKINSTLKPDYTADEILAFNQEIAIIEDLSNLNELLSTDKPIIFKKEFALDDLETLQIHAAAFFGPMLIDGLIDGIWLSNKSDKITAEQINDIAFDGNDIYIELPVTFSQVALGCTMEVETLNGKVAMKVPAGTQSGAKFKLTGNGIKNRK